MKINELFEGALLPKNEYLTQLAEVLERARTTYRKVQKQEAEEEPDYDSSEFDVDLWFNAIQFETNRMEAPFRWSLAGEDQGSKPVSLYLHSGHANDDGTVSFNLYSPHMEDGLNFDDFKMILLRFVEHEAVHMAQRDKMGAGTYANRFTGFQKAAPHFKENPKKAMKIYLSDPQEIMAHARDLYNEINQADDPLAALREIDKYKANLPTWQKFMKAGFTKDDKVIKKLLKYVTGYLNNKV